MTEKPYYVLLVRDKDNHDWWGVEFGSYVRSEVEFERRDLHEGHKSIPLKDTKIIMTSDDGAVIATVVGELNQVLNQSKPVED